MSIKPSDQRDRLIAQIDKYLAGDMVFSSSDTAGDLLLEIKTYLLSQTYWPQGIGKPKRDYSGDWKRRFRDG